MFRFQRNDWLLIGALALALAWIPASPAAGQEPDPAPTTAAPRPDSAPGTGGEAPPASTTPQSDTGSGGSALDAAPTPQPVTTPAPSAAASSPTTTAPRRREGKPAHRRAHARAGKAGRRRAGNEGDAAPVKAPAPSFTTAIVSSVRQTTDETSEAARIAAALALLGVALAGLGVIDRVRRDAGMA